MKTTAHQYVAKMFARDGKVNVAPNSREHKAALDIGLVARNEPEDVMPVMVSKRSSAGFTIKRSPYGIGWVVHMPDGSEMVGGIAPTLKVAHRWVEEYLDEEANAIRRTR